jgi:2-iminobutanoate/2-iminopropanoate deaminase
MRKVIMVEGAAKAAGHCSHAVIADGFACVSGQGPADPVTSIVPDGFSAQVRQTFHNVQIILQGAGAGFKDVVKVNACPSDVTRSHEFNAIYQELLPRPPPARTTVGSQLVGIRVEIDCIAILPTCPGATDAR